MNFQIEIYLHSIRNTKKNIENGMIEWRYENDGMEDGRRMVKNRDIG